MLSYTRLRIHHQFNSMQKHGVGCPKRYPLLADIVVLVGMVQPSISWKLINSHDFIILIEKHESAVPLKMLHHRKLMIQTTTNPPCIDFFAALHLSDGLKIRSFISAARPPHPRSSQSTVKVALCRQSPIFNRGRDTMPLANPIMLMTSPWKRITSLGEGSLTTTVQIKDSITHLFFQ